jgi:hypothetical protein
MSCHQDQRERTPNRKELRRKGKRENGWKKKTLYARGAP